MMKRLRRIAQFARAAFRGARLYRRLGYPLLPVAWGALASIFAPVGRRAPFATRLHRMRACRGCEVYDPKLQTCGNGADIEAEFEGIRWETRVSVRGSMPPGTRAVAKGCQCWLPLKVGVPRARCWLGEAYDQSRWKK